MRCWDHLHWECTKQCRAWHSQKKMLKWCGHPTYTHISVFRNTTKCSSCATECWLNLWINGNCFNIRSCGQLTTFLGECSVNDVIEDIALKMHCKSHNDYNTFYVWNWTYWIPNGARRYLSAILFLLLWALWNFISLEQHSHMGL